MTRANPRFLLAGGSAVGVLVVFLAIIRQFGLMMGLAALIVLPLILWVAHLATKNQRLLVAALCTVAVVMPGLSYWLSWPGWSQYAVDLMVVVFLAGAVVGRRKNNAPFLSDTPILLFVLLLVALLLIARGFSLRSVQSLWPLILGPVVVVAMMNSGLDAHDVRPLLRWLFLLCVLQFVVIIVQRMVLQIESADRIGGTFGRAGTTQIAVLMACFWVALVAYLSASRRWRVAILLAIPLASMAFAEAKAGFLLASIGSLLVAGAWFYKHRVREGLIAVAAIVLPILVGYVILRYFSETFLGSSSAGEFWLSALSDPQSQLGFYQGAKDTGQVQRIGSLVLVWDTLESQGSIAFGFGLGALNTSGYFGADASVAGWLANALGWTPAAGRLLFETGIVGLTGFCLLILVQTRHGIRLLRAAKGMRAVVAVTCLGLVGVFLLSGFYTQAWTFRALLIPFWVSIGLVRLYEQSEAAAERAHVSFARRRVRKHAHRARTNRPTLLPPITDSAHPLRSVRSGSTIPSTTGHAPPTVPS